MQTPSVASIPNALVAVAFLQVWETESASCQEGWLDTMRANIDLLRTKPGFVSMLLHRSLDPRNLCVYAQWLDKEHLESAVTDAKVQGAREKLDRWAQPDGTLYSFHSLVAPPNSAETALEIAADSALAFVNVWECGDPTGNATYWRPWRKKRQQSPAMTAFSESHYMRVLTASVLELTGDGKAWKHSRRRSRIIRKLFGASSGSRSGGHRKPTYFVSKESICRCHEKPYTAAKHP